MSTCRQHVLLPLAALIFGLLAASSAWSQQPGSPPANAPKPPAGQAASPNSGTTPVVPPASGEKTKTTPAAIMQIKKELPGEFTYQFVPRSGEPTAPSTLPSPTGGETLVALTIPAEIKPAEAQLQVVDNGRGNVARLPVATQGVTALTESSFKFIQVVRVPVQSKSLGVHGAQVTLTSGDKKFQQSVLLQPSDGGVATFRNVPLGEPVTVSVRYGSNPPEIQTKTLTLDHPADGYRWTPIALDWKDVKTVAAPAPPPGAASGTAPPPVRTETGTGVPADTRPQAAPPATGGGLFGNLLSTLVSLAILGAIAYGIYRAYLNGQLKTLLERLGIQTGPLTATGPAAPNPFTKPERTPIQPITEGTADPLMGGAAVVGGMAPTAPGYTPNGSGPRLVATMGTYAGTIFPVAEASVDIGRDPGNPIALPNDTNASRRHATILVNSGQYAVQDNNSSNGTFVNGVRIVTGTPQPLRPGDEVQIGKTRFRFEA